MAISKPRVVPEAIAGKLAGLFAIQQDLIAARAYCQRLQRECQDRRNAADWAVVEGLSEAAVVRYARSFTSGRRVTLDESYVDRELLATHQSFLSLRNLHVAHSVIDYEQGSVTVHVLEPPDPPTVQTIGMSVARVSGLDPQAADQLLRLCDSVLANLSLKINEAQHAVECAVHTLPHQEVYSWPVPRPFSPTGRQRPYRRDK
jgi:hypothetical protein